MNKRLNKELKLKIKEIEEKNYMAIDKYIDKKLFKPKKGI